jgi:hypothetical protein
MRPMLVHIALSIATIAAFSLAGFAIIRLLFAIVCRVTGHQSLADMVGVVASVTLGLAIGIEAHLQITRRGRDRRTR